MQTYHFELHFRDCFELGAELDADLRKWTISAESCCDAVGQLHDMVQALELFPTGEYAVKLLWVDSDPAAGDSEDDSAEGEAETIELADAPVFEWTLTMQPLRGDVPSTTIAGRGTVAAIVDRIGDRLAAVYSADNGAGSRARAFEELAEATAAAVGDEEDDDDDDGGPVREKAQLLYDDDLGVAVFVEPGGFRVRNLRRSASHFVAGTGSSLDRLPVKRDAIRDDLLAITAAIHWLGRDPIWRPEVPGLTIRRLQDRECAVWNDTFCWVTGDAARASNFAAFISPDVLPDVSGRIRDTARRLLLAVAERRGLEVPA